MKALKISLVLVFITGTIFAADLRVPQDYTHVSDALAEVESGDRILISPGSYTDISYWFVPYDIENVTILGQGNSPSEVKYIVPEGYYWAILLQTNCRLENIQVGTNNASFVIQVADDSTGVEIRNVVVSPIKSDGIRLEQGTETELRNVTVCGNREKWSTGISFAGFGSVVVKNSIFYNSYYAFCGALATSEISEYHNCYDQIQYVVPDYYELEIDPTSIVGSSGISYPDWAPPYGSIVIDAGDPSGYDPDGTFPDIGAMRYNQTSHLIGFGETAPVLLPGLDNGSTPQIFRAGDEFKLWSVVTKPVGYPLVEPGTEADIYLILDVYGEMWFWPNWSQGEVDFATVSLVDGYFQSELIFDFTWPVVSGYASGLRLWASTLMTSTEGYRVGPIAMLEFGYE